jgi:hypothetical protein
MDSKMKDFILHNNNNITKDLNIYRNNSNLNFNISNLRDSTIFQDKEKGNKNSITYNKYFEEKDSDNSTAINYNINNSQNLFKKKKLNSSPDFKDWKIENENNNENKKEIELGIEELGIGKGIRKSTDDENRMFTFKKRNLESKNLLNNTYIFLIFKYSTNKLKIFRK